MRRLIAIAVLFVAAVALVILLSAGSLLWVLVRGGPPVNLHHRGDGVSVDLLFLGEYCAGATSAQLRSMDGQLAWSVRRSGPDYSHLCRFDLVAGENPTIPGNHDDLEVLYPEDGGVFHLDGGRSYTLVVCGNNGVGLDRCSRKTVQIP